MKKPIKEKIKQFSSLNKDVNIVVCGFNDFKYITPIKTYRKLTVCTFHFVESGSGLLFVNNKKFEVKKGQCFFLFTNVPVMYYPKEDDPWKYFWLDITGEKAEILAKAMGFSVDNPVKNIKKDNVFDKLKKILQNSMGEDFSFYSAMSLFYEIVGENYISSKKNSADYGICERVKGIIDINYLKQDFTVELAIQTAHVSHAYLCKLFKSKYKITVKEYLIEKRLGKATEIIKSGEKLTVKEIAFLSGFNDEFHFMKLFKKRYGLTIKEFQKKQAE